MTALAANHLKLTRPHALALLSELDTASGLATTLYLPRGSSAADAAPYLAQVQSLSPMRREIENAITASQTGTALFLGNARKLLISPPFPLTEKYLAGGYDTSPLKTLLSRDWKIGIVLVRLGSYSIGMCEGDCLIEHKTGTGQVHGRQRQGGSSSKRYVRRREEQTHHFMERVAEHAEEKLAPYAKSLDFLVYGGARFTIRELLKHGRFLAQFENRLLPPLLTIPDPRYDVLLQAVTDIWSSRVTEWAAEG